jgi:hypothetical protein
MTIMDTSQMVRLSKLRPNVLEIYKTRSLAGDNKKAAFIAAVAFAHSRCPNLTFGEVSSGVQQALDQPHEGSS